MSERLGQLDLVFVVDNTGSMGPYIATTKTKILEIIRTIKKEELCHRLRVGLVSYRDHPPEETTYVTQKYELTSEIHKIEENIKQMSASGGGDGPEAVDTALHVANRMEFLRESAKIMVLIGDAPPHGVESTGRWKDGSPDGMKWADESKIAYDKGIVIHTVGCFPEIAGYENAVKVYEQIAKNSEGNFFPLNKAELLVKIITGIAVEEIDKLAIQQSILEDLKLSMDDFSEDEEISPSTISELTKKIRGRGFSKRAVRHRASIAGSAPESVEIENEEVSEEDVREAVRQLRRKSSK
ncbi:MAG: vWA domain-containing protein [Candidatus Thorarchaeota archaeon]